jgi:aryl-alcohol dehydrogenase-like predicted oxidoreductase
MSTAAGVAEQVLGEALAGIKRDSVVLATKLFFPMSDTDRGLSRAQIEKQIDASLERLKVSYVDLYQCHRYDAQTPLEETMEALTRGGSRGGKARYIGFSEWPVDRIAAALANATSREIRLESAAVFAAAPRSGTRCSFRFARARGFRRSSGRRSRRAF